MRIVSTEKDLTVIEAFLSALESVPPKQLRNQHRLISEWALLLKDSELHSRAFKIVARIRPRD